MNFNGPKDDAKYRWTQHVVRKMMYYGLSADRVKRVIRVPKRMEEGVAPGTVAVMQPAGSVKNPTEIWVMYAERSGQKAEGSGQLKLKQKLATNHLPLATHDLFRTRQKVVITAWRYPGVSPVRSAIPIPEGVLHEIQADLDQLDKEQA